MTVVVRDTFEEAVEKFNAVIGDRFDKTAEDITGSNGCWYEVHNGKEPGCIVGQYLFADGVSMGTLYHFDYGEFGQDGTAVSNLVDAGLLEFSDNETLALFKQVQSYQDKKSTWGQSLTNAISDVKGEA